MAYLFSARNFEHLGDGIAYDVAGRPFGGQEPSTDAEESRWSTAAGLLDAVGEGVGLVQTPEDRDFTIHRICTALISISQSLDRELPTEAVLAGGARLLVERNSPTCWWNTMPPTVTLDVRELFHREAMQAGGLETEIANPLADILVTRFLDGSWTPGGFVRMSEDDGLIEFSCSWVLPEFD